MLHHRHLSQYFGTSRKYFTTTPRRMKKQKEKMKKGARLYFLTRLSFSSRGQIHGGFFGLTPRLFARLVNMCCHTRFVGGRKKNKMSALTVPAFIYQQQLKPKRNIRTTLYMSIVCRMFLKSFCSGVRKSLKCTM